MTLEERVAALERQVAQEAQLRASVDSDLSGVSSAVRASHLLVQALAITQMEHTTKLERLASVQAEHTEALRQVNSGVAAILALLDELVRRDGGGSQ